MSSSAEDTLTIIDRSLPEWFHKAKLGIFIHWGVYSVPAFAPTKETNSICLNCSEWYLRKLKNPFTDRGVTRQRHEQLYGSNHPYEAFLSDFTADKWDPNQWAELFRKAGAGYVVFTSKHHDGFCNWPTKHPSQPKWTSAELNRDFVGELRAAVEKSGLQFGTYYSLYEWYNSIYKKKATTNHYVQKVVFPQMKELVETYRPSILWLDGDWEKTSSYWHCGEFLFSRAKGTFSVPRDRFSPDRPLGYKWECCVTIGKSWGYNAEENESHYKSSSELIHLLVRTVCCGGNLLINVGPRADGTIPEPFEERLTNLGEWMAIHGSVIYDCDPCGGVTCNTDKHCREKILSDASSAAEQWYAQSASSDNLYYMFLLLGPDTAEWPKRVMSTVLSPSLVDDNSIGCLNEEGDWVKCTFKIDRGTRSGSPHECEKENIVAVVIHIPPALESPVLLREGGVLVLQLRGFALNSN